MFMLVFHYIQIEYPGIFAFSEYTYAIIAGNATAKAITKMFASTFEYNLEGSTKQ